MGYGVGGLYSKHCCCIKPDKPLPEPPHIPLTTSNWWVEQEVPYLGERPDFVGADRTWEYVKYENQKGEMITKLIPPQGGSALVDQAYYTSDRPGNRLQKTCAEVDPNVFLDPLMRCNNLVPSQSFLVSRDQIVTPLARYTVLTNIGQKNPRVQRTFKFVDPGTLWFRNANPWLVEPWETMGFGTVSYAFSGPGSVGGRNAAANRTVPIHERSAVRLGWERDIESVPSVAGKENPTWWDYLTFGKRPRPIGLRLHYTHYWNFGISVMLGEANYSGYIYPDETTDKKDISVQFRSGFAISAYATDYELATDVRHAAIGQGGFPTILWDHRVPLTLPGGANIFDRTDTVRDTGTGEIVVDVTEPLQNMFIKSSNIAVTTILEPEVVHGLTTFGRYAIVLGRVLAGGYVMWNHADTRLDRTKGQARDGFEWIYA